MLGPPPVSFFWNLSNKPEMDKCYHRELQSRIWLWTMVTSRSTGVMVTRRPLLFCNLPARRQFERLPRHLSGSRYLSHHIFGSCGRACPSWPRTCLEATTDNMFSAAIEGQDTSLLPSLPRCLGLGCLILRTQLCVGIDISPVNGAALCCRLIWISFT